MSEIHMYRVHFPAFGKKKRERPYFVRVAAPDPGEAGRVAARQLKLPEDLIDRIDILKRIPGEGAQWVAIQQA